MSYFETFKSVKLISFKRSLKAEQFKSSGAWQVKGLSLLEAGDWSDCSLHKDEIPTSHCLLLLISESSSLDFNQGKLKHTKCSNSGDIYYINYEN